MLCVCILYAISSLLLLLLFSFILFSISKAWTQLSVGLKYHQFIWIDAIIRIVNISKIPNALCVNVIDDVVQNVFERFTPPFFIQKLNGSKFTHTYLYIHEHKRVLLQNVNADKSQTNDSIPCRFVCAIDSHSIFCIVALYRETNRHSDTLIDYTFLQSVPIDIFTVHFSTFYY